MPLRCRVRPSDVAYAFFCARATPSATPEVTDAPLSHRHARLVCRLHFRRNVRRVRLVEWRGWHHQQRCLRNVRNQRHVVGNQRHVVRNQRHVVRNQRHVVRNQRHVRCNVGHAGRQLKFGRHNQLHLRRLKRCARLIREPKQRRTRLQQRAQSLPTGQP